MSGDDSVLVTLIFRWAEARDAGAGLIGWYQRRGYRLTGRSTPFPYDNVRFGIPRRPDLRFAELSKPLAAGQT